MFTLITLKIKNPQFPNLGFRRDHQSKQKFAILGKRERKDVRSYPWEASEDEKEGGFRNLPPPSSKITNGGGRERVVDLMMIGSRLECLMCV